MVEMLQIVTLVGIICTFLLNVYQSARSKHFESECFNCCSMKYESEMKEKQVNNTV